MIKEKLECAICGKEIEVDLLKSRVKVIIGKVSYVPKTWDICNECRKLELTDRRKG